MGSVLRAVYRFDRLTVGEDLEMPWSSPIFVLKIIDERCHLTQGTEAAVISVRFVGVDASLPPAVAGTVVRLGASLVVVGSDVEASLSTYSEVRKSAPTVISTVSGATASDAMALRLSSSAR